MRDKEKIGLPPEKQEEYVLLQTKPYENYYGWKEGDKLRRISIWLSANGCGIRQGILNRSTNQGMTALLGRIT